MNGRIRRMMREIERRGGKLYVNPQLPDALAELFLAEVLACPDCAAAGGVTEAVIDGCDSEPWRSAKNRNRGKGH